MRCPHCKELESKVVDSRSCEDGNAIRRRRECIICQRRFTSYERLEERPLVVVKREGKRENFERKKILNGITKACEKRSISVEVIENLAAEIERELRDLDEREVSSVIIGEKIMTRLRTLDEVAYVRFASVYRQFADLNSFVNMIEQIKKN